ncbi:MAG: diaminohydroxyphosphoribosylaminopyrimidine deaminase [Solirubrobacterales bacterium]|jgi:diaminohydroxyphosphoribosylaminopyrimidine deaminase/5-amino-6-(5-phosphoribosylamino)uracil reductase|nr:diaminohydroxyphosphoribosylaminopyrimidine deaminase [Solirubrobacterales bacterium]
MTAMAPGATAQDAAHLRRALELAEGGRGRVSPNPLVGAVLVRDGETIGEGFHAELGGLHAETAAIADCRERGEDPAGATLYVTLEPCAHSGRQPPCAEAILAAGIARVVIGCDDPSEKAAGRGPGMLRDGGVEVAFADGAEATAARLLIQDFRKRARTGKPLVVFKAALSLDGRMATAEGDSKWLSGPDSRALVHAWRAQMDAVAVGIGTVLADDPLLTARDVEPAAAPTRQPARVVFDSEARLPLGSKLVATVDQAPLLVIAAASAVPAQTAALTEAGAEVIVVAGETQQDRAAAALAELGRRGIQSVLLEGGPTLAGALLAGGEVDELRFFLAPVIIGGVIGSGGRSPDFAQGTAQISEAQRALSFDARRVGADLLIDARLREW